MSEAGVLKLDFHQEAVKRRFCRQAVHYAHLNTLQIEVAKQLISLLPSKPKRILDLGCGSGAVFDRIDWPVERFVAVDFAAGMCELHPKSPAVIVCQADFNRPDEVARLAEYGPYDLIISSSALQWADDLDATLKAVSGLGNKVAFALFTSGTFQTLRQHTGLSSALHTPDAATTIIRQYFNVQTQVRRFVLSFPDRRALFDYIRTSGIGGGIPKLGVGQTRSLIAGYPHLELEFETLFAVSR